MIDDEPVSAREIINRASEIDEVYEAQFIKQTSVASQILRRRGHKITDNPNWINPEAGNGVAFVILLLAIFFLGLAMATDTSEVEVKEEDQPCGYFKNYTVKNIPARCLKYFDGSEEQSV